MFDLAAAIVQERVRRTGAGLAAPVQDVKPTIQVVPPARSPVQGTGTGVIFVDLETYYDSEFNLKKLTVAEYVRDARFAVLCVGVSYQGRRYCLSADEFRQRAAATPWERLTVVAHNAQFDGAVLEWHFGVAPLRWCDTLAMARGAYPQRGDYSLGALATDLGIGAKSDALEGFKGVRMPDAEQWVTLSTYNEKDLVLLEGLHAQLSPHYPQAELDLIDLTVRQYVQPRLILDIERLQGQIHDDARKRESVLAGLGVAIGDLRSKAAFADHLKALGVTAPTKKSVKTGKQDFAFSIKDAEFVALLDHPQEAVRSLIIARINAMSNVSTTRAEKLLTLAALGPLSVQLNYYGAATGRYSGGGGINLQNLPRDSELRYAIQAPSGHALVGCDSAQIEARVLAWLARQEDLLSAFRSGRDVYCEFASVFFGRIITKSDVMERKIGKTAILGLGYGMGKVKFAGNLATSGLTLTDEEVARLVKTYRATYANIQSLWRSAGRAFTAPGTLFGQLKMQLHDERIRLPNGLDLHYPSLQKEDDGQWRYSGRTGRETLYGSKLVENVVQALARIVVMEQQLAIAKAYPVVFSVHDELVCCVPEARADECKVALVGAMSTPPSWAPDLPLACEAAMGRSYGDL